MLQAVATASVLPDADLHILIISDDKASRQHLVTLARRAGYQSIDACDTGEAWQLVQGGSPSLILIEGPLLAHQGIDLIRRFRTSSLALQPYVILVANRQDDPLVTAAFESGIDDVIRKPLRPRIVAARLRTGQRLRQLERKVEHQQEELQRYADALTRSNRRLRELALTDELTGLPNRRYAIERLQVAWSAAERSASRLSCLVIDVEGIKGINQGHGYERGDVTLKTVAAILREQAKPRDFVCRFGGDEFLVICPETPAEEVVAWGEAMVKALNNFELEAGDHALGLCMGVAERHTAMTHPLELLSLAEQSMYRAKNAGRHQVCAALPDETMVHS